jgi:hypothetical protein
MGGGGGGGGAKGPRDLHRDLLRVNLLAHAELTLIVNRSSSPKREFR